MSLSRIWVAVPSLKSRRKTNDKIDKPDNGRIDTVVAGA
jgi:hypothetical protein